MKDTGIVRQIDDLGRVVIPKEIRRTMNIRERDSLEIFLDKEFICLRKYDYNLTYIDTLKQMKTNIEEVPDLKNRNEILQKLKETISVLEKSE